MSAAAINRRKSQLFLTSIVPVSNTYDQLVAQKLKRGKFPQTKTGIIKMTSLSFQLGSLATRLLLEQTCWNSSLAKYGVVASIFAGFLGQLVLFVVFSSGRTALKPGFWIKTDVAFNSFISLSTIAISTIYLEICKSANQIEHVSSALVMTGSVLSILGCAAIVLMYRYVEDPEDQDESEARRVRRDPVRKSIFA